MNLSYHSEIDFLRFGTDLISYFEPDLTNSSGFSNFISGNRSLKFRSKTMKKNKCLQLERRKFTMKEDMMLTKYLIRYGRDWRQIETHFPNRSWSKLKNRYYSCLRKAFVLNALAFIVKDLEAAGSIDECSEEIFEEFQKFIPSVE